MQLVIENVCVERSGRRIIDSLSLSVRSREALVLTGPNGAGKTTLIRTVAGLIRPSAGAIRLVGGIEDARVAEQVHYVGHLNALKVSLSVSENLRFWAAYLGARTTDAIDAALEAFALAPLAAIPAGYLSAGQKRRACLARLLVVPRPLWLLDEPTVSLDRDSVDLLARQIDAHVASGGIVMAATHIPLGLASERLFEMCRREVRAA